MKKYIFISSFLIGKLTSFGQVKAKEKDIDKESNVVMDSLSKVYKVKVQSYMVETYNGIIQTSISYVKDKKLVLHCRSGKRSLTAGAKLLEENPNLEIYNLEGGIIAWNNCTF